MSTANLQKVLIMAGGTGGHVYPALSVAEKLIGQNVIVEWLGTRRGIENDLVPKKNLPLHFVSISGLRGKNILRWVMLPWQLSRAVVQALLLIKRIKPDLVLGLGGFASGPGGLAAWLLSKPLVIHEQNAVPGTTNRWLNKLSTCSLQAFPNSLRGATTVGNPIRDNIVSMAPPQERLIGQHKKPRLLILGGSLGALKLNQLIPESLSGIEKSQRPEVWHQTGSAHHQFTLNLYNKLGVDGRVEPFVDSMHLAYGWADLVICRAGALTVSEISSAGVAAVFIPYPYAIDDHQAKNAQYLVEKNAALVIDEEELNVEKLKQLFTETLTNKQQLVKMAVNAREASVSDAAENVAAKCMELING